MKTETLEAWAQRHPVKLTGDTFIFRAMEDARRFSEKFIEPIATE